MRRTRHDEILSTAYTARIEAVEALQAAGLGSPDAAARLKSSAIALRISVAEYGEALSATTYEALGDLVEMIGQLLDWRAAILNAGTDAQRFVTAAKERASIWVEKYASEAPLVGLRAIADEIAKVRTVSEVGPIAVHLAAAPLPVGLFSVQKTEFASATDTDGAETKSAALQVAFLKFTIDGNPLAKRTIFRQASCMISMSKYGFHDGLRMLRLSCSNL
jgi:hypothetical protein